MIPIQNSNLWNEVNHITNSTCPKPFAEIRASVHLLDAKKTVHSAKVFNFDIVRDYSNNFSDEVTISMAFPQGTFHDLLYPYKDNIEISITAVEAIATPNNTYKGARFTKRYKAKLMDSIDERVTPTPNGQESTSMADLGPMVVANFQCVDFAVYKLRMVNVGAIIRESNLKDAMQTLLSQQCSIMKLPADEAIAGIDVEEPDNKEIFKQIIIDQGTNLSDIPDFLQNGSYGIYEHGLTSYIQNKIWYICPKHDVTRQPRGDKYITINVIPKNILPGVNSSFRRIGNQWSILCTGNLQLQNIADVVQVSLGDKLKYSEPNAAISDIWTEIKDNKVKIKSDIANNQLGNKFTENGLSQAREKPAPYMKNAFTQNPLKLQSEVNLRSSGLLSCLWENSFPKIIEPGTRVKVLYQALGFGVLELHGTVIKAHHSVQLMGKGVTSNVYATNTGLGIWVEDDEPLRIYRAKKVTGYAEGFVQEGASSKIGDNETPGANIASAQQFLNSLFNFFN